MQDKAMQAARRLLEARDARTPIALADWRGERLAPADEAAGYAIQAAVERIRTDERGGRRIGYKIGATNAAARTLLGVATPFFGRLYDRTSTTSPTRLALVAGHHLVLEPEVALEIGTALDPAATPFDARAIARATRSVRPAIEVVATCLAPWLEAGAPSLIADNAVHGHWIGGEAHADWSGLDLLDAPVTVTAGGAVAATGSGRAVDGGAFGAAAWLANRLAADGLALAPGDIISTGTVTKPVELVAGQSFDADFGGLGTVRLET